MDRAYSSINSLLEQATCIARRKKETTGTLEPTESYKRGQTEELIKFANSNDLWISLSELNVEFCAVLTQPYILAEREATENEIATYMKALGFD